MKMNKKTFTALSFLLFCFLNILPAGAQVTRLFEGFEGGIFPPEGWQRVNVSGSVMWIKASSPLGDSFGNNIAKQGTAVAFINYQAPDGEDWLISSKTTSVIGAGDSLVFWIIKQFSDGPHPYDSLIVKVSTTDSLRPSFTNVAGRICVHCLPIGMSEIKWRRYSFPLSVYAGNNIYIGFQHKNSNGHGLVLDSIAVFGPFNTIGIEPISNVVPAKFELYQNYPNPFNPNTNIKFDIPKNGFTTLKVYDMTGSEVSSLVSDELNAGTYSINFDASKLSSGIYMYRLESSGIVKTQKMTLVK